MMNKYDLGDVVNIKEYDIKSGVIISVEKVTSNPRMAPFDKLSDYLETLDTYQYEIAYELEGQVYKDTYYESYIDEQKGEVD